MANKIKVLRSSVAGRRPTGREAGELYINTADKAAGAVFDAGATHDFAIIDVANVFTKQQSNADVALVDAATIAWDVDAAPVATFTFVASNRAMGVPTNLKNGAFYALALTQGAASHTMTWPAVFKWNGGKAPTLSTAAGAKDYFVFRADGVNLMEQGRSMGVS
jgi:hypothetical protein